MVHQNPVNIDDIIRNPLPLLILLDVLHWNALQTGEASLNLQLCKHQRYSTAIY